MCEVSQIHDTFLILKVSIHFLISCLERFYTQYKEVDRNRPIQLTGRKLYASYVNFNIKVLNRIICMLISKYSMWLFKFLHVSHEYTDISQFNS